MGYVMGLREIEKDNRLDRMGITLEQIEAVKHQVKVGDKIRVRHTAPELELARVGRDGATISMLVEVVAIYPHHIHYQWKSHGRVFNGCIDDNMLYLRYRRGLL